jgi:hypothetical protein
MDKYLGRTVLLSNYRGDGKQRMGKVVAIRDTHTNILSPAKKVLTRGRYLLTVQHSNGYRSYYVDHTDNITILSTLGVLWYKLFLKG